MTKHMNISTGKLGMFMPQEEESINSFCHQNSQENSFVLEDFLDFGIANKRYSVL